MSARFVVRTLEGWRINPGNSSRATSNGRPGLVVWVADEALYGREVKVWRSERLRGRFRRAWMLAEARRYADKLNWQAD